MDGMKSDEALDAESEGNNKDTKKKAKPYICTICGKYFDILKEFSDHFQQNHMEKPKFTCGLCQKTFVKERQLSKHIQTVHEGTVCKCKECGLKFKSESSLKRHMKYHVDAVPEECDICGKSFSSKTRLQIHRKIHTGEKQFVCPVCSRVFKARSVLTDHMRTHSDEDAFKCKYCDKAFKTRRRIYLHIKRCHETNSSYACKVCGRAFLDAWKLRKHEQSHENQKTSVVDDKVICPVCNHVLNNQYTLANHMRKIHAESLSEHKQKEGSRTKKQSRVSKQEKPKEVIATDNKVINETVSQPHVPTATVTKSREAPQREMTNSTVPKRAGPKEVMATLPVMVNMVNESHVATAAVTKSSEVPQPEVTNCAVPKQAGTKEVMASHPVMAKMVSQSPASKGAVTKSFEIKDSSTSSAPVDPQVLAVTEQLEELTKTHPGSTTPPKFIVVRKKGEGHEVSYLKIATDPAPNPRVIVIPPKIPKIILSPSDLPKHKSYSKRLEELKQANDADISLAETVLGKKALQKEDSLIPEFMTAERTNCRKRTRKIKLLSEKLEEVKKANEAVKVVSVPKGTAQEQGGYGNPVEAIPRPMAEARTIPQDMTAEETPPEAGISANTIPVCVTDYNNQRQGMAMEGTGLDEAYRTERGLGLATAIDWAPAVANQEFMNPLERNSNDMAAPRSGQEDLDWLLPMEIKSEPMIEDEEMESKELNEGSNNDENEGAARNNHGATEEGPIFSCSECKKEFLTVYELNDHEEMFWSETSKSLTCGKPFLRINLRPKSSSPKKPERKPVGKSLDSKTIRSRLKAKINKKKKKQLRAKSGTRPAFQMPKSNMIGEDINEENICVDSKNLVLCPGCSFVFADDQGLNKHLKDSHRCRGPDWVDLDAVTYTDSDDTLSAGEESDELEPDANVQKEGPVTCEVCYEVFGDSSILSLHMNVHSVVGDNLIVQQEIEDPDEQNSTCIMCDKSFKDQNSLRQHIASHYENMSLVCRDCGQAFPGLTDLRKHQENCTGERHQDAVLEESVVPAGCKCNICGASFTIVDDLEAHMRQHTWGKSFACSLCCEIFHMNDSLNLHMKTHQESKKTFKCLECDKMFTNSGGFRLHMMSHSKESKQACKVCGKYFEDLKGHMASHTKTDLPFKCSVCGKAFLHKSRMEFHMRIHGEVKETFPCDHCPMVFITKASAEEHAVQEHGE